MKRTVVILGAICLAMFTGLWAFAYWAIGSQEKDKNRDRTAKAREASIASRTGKNGTAEPQQQPDEVKSEEIQYRDNIAVTDNAG